MASPPTGEHMEVVYHVLHIERMPGDRQETQCFLVLLPRQNSPLKTNARTLSSQQHMTAYRFSDTNDAHLKKLSEQAKVSKAERWKQIEGVWKRRAIIARRRYTKMRLHGGDDVLLVS